MWKVTSNMFEGRHQLYKKPILLFAEIPKIEILGFAMKKIDHHPKIKTLS